MKAAWIGDGLKLECRTLISLIQHYKTDEWNALDIYAKHKNILFTGLTALLGLGAYVSVRSEQALLHVSILFPVLVELWRRFSIETLDRYYLRFLEAVVVIKKLEYLSGLHKKVYSEAISAKDEDSQAPFLEDCHLDVDRRHKSLANIEKNSSKYWILDHMKKGHNRVTRNLFRTIFIISCFVPCLSLAHRSFEKNALVPISFIIEAIIILIIAILFYKIDSRGILKQRFETSISKEKGDWKTFVKICKTKKPK
jgi:hypothetical protein